MKAGADLPYATPASARRRHRGRRALVGLAILGPILLAGGLLVTYRYVSALEDARALRTGLEAMVARAQDAGLEMDRQTIDALESDLSAASGRLKNLADLLAHDLPIGIARALPPTAPTIRGADDLVAAAAELLEAADEGLIVGRRLVEITAAHAAGSTNTSALAEIVELLATTRSHAATAAGAVHRARDLLARVPDGLIGPIASIRDAMAIRVDAYGPVLDAYVTAGGRLPAILGWDGPRRYLVLTQDPAELRPSGGLIGSYGLITFDRGRITERTFLGVAPLDGRNDYPFVRPPQELADYLLGPTQSWQLADAGWSPDFPTSARHALRLYTNESRDGRINGVLAITTHTIDQLLTVTGPISVPEYDATIGPGETTLKVLQLTRAPRRPGEDAKAFLPVFADHLFGALLALPPRTWGSMLDSAEAIVDQRLLQAWFRSPEDQAFAASVGVDGGVRQDPGDFVYVVESNVAPATKLSAWTSRSMDLSVEIDPLGNARNTLSLDWHNLVDTVEAAPYRAMTNVGGRILGLYVRLLIPERSRVKAVVGGGLAPVTSPAVVGDEAGRMVIGSYLKVGPGHASLSTTWISPYAATTDTAGGTYRLTIQRQPGALPTPLTLTIRAPAGYRITGASRGLAASGATATMAVSLDQDVEVGVRYEPVASGASTLRRPESAIVCCLPNGFRMPWPAR